MLRPLKNPCEIAVIGGGMAGLCAAGHAARLGRSVTLFEGSGVWGGQIATVGHVDGLPVAGHQSGQDVAIGLLEAMRGPLLRIVERGVARVEAAADLTLTDDAGDIHHPGAVIVASGASLRRLGVPGERELAGRGVSHCATCDGGFFRGEDVAVVGGGDSALQEALTLTDICRHVHIVCRSATRAKRSYVDRLAAKRNASFVWGAAVTAVLGDKGVSGLALRDGADGRAFELACTGVFPVHRRCAERRLPSGDPARPERPPARRSGPSDRESPYLRGRGDPGRIRRPDRPGGGGGHRCGRSRRRDARRPELRPPGRTIPGETCPAIRSTGALTCVQKRTTTASTKSSGRAASARQALRPLAPSGSTR